MFPDGGDGVSDQMLIQAMRKRLLEEISRREDGASRIVNNVYGAGGGQPAGMNGVSDQLGGLSPEDLDYFVDIQRRDVTDPESQERIGWDKNVHRYTKKKT